MIPYCMYVRVSNVLHMGFQPQHGTPIIISLTDAYISITPNKTWRPVQPPRDAESGDSGQFGIIIGFLVLRISYVGLPGS